MARTRSPTPRVDTAWIQSSWITATRGLLGRRSRPRQAREVRALARLRHARIERPRARVEGAVAMTVALGGARPVALVPAHTDLAPTSQAISRANTSSAASFMRLPPPRFGSTSSGDITSSVIVPSGPCRVTRPDPVERRGDHPGDGGLGHVRSFARRPDLGSPPAPWRLPPSRSQSAVLGHRRRASPVTEASGLIQEGDTEHLEAIKKAYARQCVADTRESPSLSANGRRPWPQPGQS